MDANSNVRHLKPGDEGVPYPEVELSAEEAQVDVEQGMDFTTPTDADIDGDDYTGELPEDDDDAVAESMDEGEVK